MMELLQTNLTEILMLILTTLATTLGVFIKNAYSKFIDTQMKKDIIKTTVEYVEQIYKNVSVSSEEKFNKAKDKALEWLNLKGIKISDTELEILIESTVNSFNKALKENNI